MKHYFLLVLMYLLLGLSAVGQQSPRGITELPITFHEGTGAFWMPLAGLGYDRTEDSNNPWLKTYEEVKGIPEEWTEVKKGHITLDMHQFVYQHYHAGNIAPEFYEQLQSSWNWTPDTTVLSKKPLKCSVVVVRGIDKEGKEILVVDRNNNGDVSDDIPFYPLKKEEKTDEAQIMQHAVYISYEQFRNDKAVPREVPLVIADVEHPEILFYAFPVYGSATLEDRELRINLGFTNMTYDAPGIYLWEDGKLKEGEKIPRDAMVGKEEYIQVNDKLYKNVGINKNKEVLLLEEVDKPKTELYSTQTGFRALPFEGERFDTKESLSLEQQKGKYVYLDFWAIWCGPCLQELPGMKTLYEELDKSKIEFIGVAGHSPAEGLQQVMEKSEITWPQLSSDEIVKLYNVNGFPTTFLIDPEGMIIAKDLRTEELKSKLKELGIYE